MVQQPTTQAQPGDDTTVAPTQDTTPAATASASQPTASSSSTSLPQPTSSDSPLPGPQQPGGGSGSWPSTVTDSLALERGLTAMLPILAGAIVVMGLTLLLRPPRRPV